MRFSPAGASSCLLALALAALLSTGSRASATNLPFSTAGSFSHNLQKYTGVTAAANFFTSTAIAAALKHKIKGQFKVKVQNYSLTDLLAGKIKKIDITVTGWQYRSMPIKSLSITTVTPVWIRLDRHHRHVLLCPAMFAVSGAVSADNLETGLVNPVIATSLGSIKLNMPGLGRQQLILHTPQIAVHKDSVEIKTILASAGATTDKGVPMRLKGKPELIGGTKIYLRNLEIDSPDIPNPREFAAFASQIVNPIIDFSRLDRDTHAFRMETLAVADDEVRFSGNLLLAPKASTSAQKTRKR